MREKYNVFNVSKINKKTIKISQDLKEKFGKTQPFKETFLQSGSVHVPVDEYKFLEYLCLKYLHLKAEDGIPLLKEAFKLQFDVEDEYKLCKYCGKPFKFARATNIFCSDRCRQRNQRHGKTNEKRPMMSR